MPSPKILRIDTPSDYSRYHGLDDRHPLMTIIDFSRISPLRHSLNSYGVYGIFLQDKNDLDLTYGRGRYDYSDGSLICVAPGQIGGKEDNGDRVSIGGWALLFHPDLLRGTPLQREIRRYSFFDYSSNEALHMTDREHHIVENLFRDMEEEINRPRDHCQDSILVGYISLLLQYCDRFHHRQSVSRKAGEADILTRFETLLNDYYTERNQAENGIPTVSFCAERLCMSPSYFSDLIKRITGENASTLIRRHVIREAKNALSSGLTVSEAADFLGFGYPQHFSRMFKKLTGLTPREYTSRLGRHPKDTGAADEHHTT